MARSNNIFNLKNLALTITGIVLFVILLIVGQNVSGKNNFEKLPLFPTQSYINGSSLWSQSEYHIKGAFQNILVQAKNGDGALCSIVDDELKVPLPVIFRSVVNKRPLEVSTKIILKVKVRQDGAIEAIDWRPQ